MNRCKRLISKKIIWRIAALIWCSFIFANSQISSMGSGKISNYIALIVNSVIQPFFGENFYVTNFIVRKVAHFSEFFILGVLLYKCFLQSNSWTRSLLYPLLAGVIYAISDELHQYFVPGRIMSIYDIIIDTGGIVLAIVIFYNGKDIKKNRKTTVNVTAFTNISLK